MKKKKSGGGANWMDTYGDMVTLLLCFFVLLYSMSTVDESKWRAIVQSFNPSGIPTQIEDIKGGDGPSADDNQAGVEPGPVDKTQDEINEMIEALYENLQAYVESEALASSVSVEMDGGRIFVNFKDTAFFNANQWTLRTDAYPILNAMCEMLSNAAYAIDEVRILGHTAEVPGSDPVATAREDRFLSSNRATNVLVYIQEHTHRNVLDPGKLRSEGLGQWHPIDRNDTEEGRANNRRVEMIISGRNLEEELGSEIQSYTTT